MVCFVGGLLLLHLQLGGAGEDLEGLVGREGSVREGRQAQGLAAA